MAVRVAAHELFESISPGESPRRSPSRAVSIGGKSSNFISIGDSGGGAGGGGGARRWLSGGDSSEASGSFSSATGGAAALACKAAAALLDVVGGGGGPGSFGTVCFSIEARR
jgi:hypothetical protein